MNITITVRTTRRHPMQSTRSVEEHYHMTIADVSWWDRVWNKKLPDGKYRIYGLRHGNYSVFYEERDRYAGTAPDYITSAVLQYKSREGIDAEDLHIKHIW